MVRERDSASRPVSDGLSGGDNLSQPHLQTFHMRERDFMFEASQRRRRDARGTERKRSEPFRCRYNALKGYNAPRSCCAYIEGKCSIRP